MTKGSELATFHCDQHSPHKYFLYLETVIQSEGNKRARKQTVFPDMLSCLKEAGASYRNCLSIVQPYSTEKQVGRDFKRHLIYPDLPKMQDQFPLSLSD